MIRNARNIEAETEKLTARVCGLLLGLCLAVGLTAGVAYADDGQTNNLQNGSFEEGPTFSGAYSQPDQGSIPAWNTTAFQGKIELFKTNTGTYIDGVTLTPPYGTYAAELNAEEESTLYQNAKINPSSVY